MQIRRTARALLFDPAGRLLLMRLQTPQSPGPDNPHNLPFWVTIGGQMEDTESLADAIRREIAEETGITAFTFGRSVWHGQQILNVGNAPMLFDETFVVCHTSATSISTANLTEDERPIIREYRWWHAEDLASTTELIFPPLLAQLIQPLAAGNLPDHLMEIPLTLTKPSPNPSTR